jgi:hypothetical protein
MSNQLLGHFYKSLLEGNSTIKALQLAKIDALNSAHNSNLAAPFYWAGHQLIGEDVVFEVESDNSWWWLIGFFGFSVVVIFIFYYKKH